MAQTKPKAAQFYGVSGNGTAGQVLISDGNGGMSWGANTEQFTVSWATPTGQSLNYTQPDPQSSSGFPGSAFPTTTFTVTKSDTIISGTATIAGLPTGVTATQVITGSSIGNTLTVTLAGMFPGVDSLNTALTLSGLTLSKTVSWATPTGQSLTYTQPSPQSSIGNTGTTFPTTTFTATKAGEVISGTATIAGLPTGITATQSLSGTGVDNVLTVTLAGVIPAADSLNTALTLSGLTVATPLIVNYLVIAGGAGGGGNEGGGGGAGGLRTSYGNNGGGGGSETQLTLTAGTNYTVTIGAGGTQPVPTGAGAAPYGYTQGGDGNNSVFANITSTGGGGGGTGISAQSPPMEPGRDGGSGGGGSRYGNLAAPGGTRTPSPVQGFNGGSSGVNQGDSTGGGGGAGAVGQSATGGGGFDGGVGITNAITVASGTGPYYAGGGGGGAYSGSPRVGSGGNGGGGDGLKLGPPSTSNNGTDNTGGGAGGGGGSGSDSVRGGANGGSGIVILRYPSEYTISGLSGSTDTSISGVKITTFTNIGTGTISFN